MASQQAAPAAIPPASVVGNAFVHQYYNVLHQTPHMVYKFYTDFSKLGRPDLNGDMSCITTKEAINQKILSLDYGEYKAELKTVDSQDSFNQGVLVLVTGALLSKNNVKRNFTQSFFLAPQEKGYFVLNDVFRYLDDPQQLETRNVLVNGVFDQSSNPPPAEPVADPVPPQQLQEVDRQAPQLEEEELPIEEADVPPSEHGDGSEAEEEETLPTHATEVVQIEEKVTPEDPVVPSEETPKKSYASVVKVKVVKEVSATAQPPAVVRTSPPNVEQQATVPTQTSLASHSPPASQPLAPSMNVAENSSSQEAEADGRSIYIRNLPLNATNTQLEEEFKKFGPIKPGGVQVRSNKQQQFCYGFVEFELSSSVQSALQASPITIDGCTAYVEEKRPPSTRASRGRFPPARGAFRNDRGWGGGGYGGRGYGRGDFTNRGGFGGRVRGSASGRGEGYQMVDQAGNGGRGARSGGTSQSQKNVQRVGPSSS